VLCDEGYSSSLAAASLQRLGLRNATEVIGGSTPGRPPAGRCHPDPPRARAINDHRPESSPGRSRPTDPRAPLLKLAGAGRHPRQRARLQAFLGLLSLNGVDCRHLDQFSYGDVSYDGSADSAAVASLDVDGNPIQDRLSSASCVQSLPEEPQRLLGRGAGPMP
jgi:hypothetical protein